MNVLQIYDIDNGELLGMVSIDYLIPVVNDKLIFYDNTYIVKERVFDFMNHETRVYCNKIT